MSMITLKNIRNPKIVTSAAITINGIYFDSYADSAIAHVAYASRISSIYGTHRKSQISTFLFRITICSKVERNQNPFFNEFLLCVSFFLKFGILELRNRV